MSKKEVVLIASRAVALYLVFWSLGNLGNIPGLVFAMSHYAVLPPSPGRDYMYQYHVIEFSSRIVLTVGLFLAAVWIYRCGPKIERFLSPDN